MQMAHAFMFNPSTMKSTISLFFIILTTTFLVSNSARILDEVDPQEPQVINNLPLPVGSNPSLTTIPITTPQTGPDTGNEEEANDVAPVPEVEAPAADNVSVSPVVSPTNEDQIQQQPQPVAKEPSLSFFMHDILGGSHPSARVVTGIVANSDVTGLPFSKNNNNIYPITGGIPLVNPKLNGIITNNNLPLLVGLGNGQSSTVFQNRGTNNVVTGGNNQPFVSAGNLPGGFTVQKLMFGSVTVIDDQLTEGHELDSSIVGRAQGFYTANSLDGTSQSVVMTVLLHGGDDHDGVDDSISLFGVHRTASLKSEVAVIGGSGKYENARGYAALETLLKEDQHTTDGVDTIIHFNIYLTH